MSLSATTVQFEPAPADAAGLSAAAEAEGAVIGAIDAASDGATDAPGDSAPSEAEASAEGLAGAIDASDDGDASPGDSGAVDRLCAWTPLATARSRHASAASVAIKGRFTMGTSGSSRVWARAFCL